MASKKKAQKPAEKPAIPEGSVAVTLDMTVGEFLAAHGVDLEAGAEVGVTLRAQFKGNAVPWAPLRASLKDVLPRSAVERLEDGLRGALTGIIRAGKSSYDTRP